MSFKNKIRFFDNREQLEKVVAEFTKEGYKFSNVTADDISYFPGGIRGDYMGRLYYADRDFYLHDSEYMGYTFIEFGEEVKAPEACSTSAGSTNPKAALGAASLPMTRLSPLACAVGALGKYNGALKYGTSNFIGTQVVMSIYLDAIRRHFDAILMGEDVDPIDKVPHWGAIMANIDLILCAQAAGTLIDDRARADGQLEAVRALKPLVASLQELHKGKEPKHYLMKEVMNGTEQASQS